MAVLTVPAISAKFGIPHARVRGWIARGLLVSCGRIPGFAKNSSGMLVFEERDVLRVLHDPPRRGRPSRKQTTQPIG